MNEDLFLAALGSHLKHQWLWLVVESPVVEHLEKLMHRNALPAARAALSKNQDYVENWNLEMQTWWSIVDKMLTCAEIAAIDPHVDAHMFQDLLCHLAPGTAAIDLNVVAAGTGGAQNRLRSALRDGLAKLSWQPQFCSGWAWDLVCHFWNTPRRPAHTTTTTTLLVDEWTGDGYVARLTMEWLPEEGTGDLYPDPVTLPFLIRDQSFLEAERNAVNAMRENSSLWSSSHADVRWRLERQDGRQLLHIGGGSAGGAFALALAHLMTKISGP